MGTILTIYFIIAAIIAFITLVILLHGEEIEGVDNAWDWMVYSLFWIKFIIKAVIKILFTNWKN